MAKIIFDIPCDGEMCGKCATIKKRRYDNDFERYEPWCDLFGRYLPYEISNPAPKRLPKCIASEVKKTVLKTSGVHYDFTKSNGE